MQSKPLGEIETSELKAHAECELAMSGMQELEQQLISFLYCNSDAIKQLSVLDNELLLFKVQIHLQELMDLWMWVQATFGCDNFV